MFTRIARRYDLMNSLMTGGRHHAWRRKVAESAAGAPAGPLLDLATGTADLAIAGDERADGGNHMIEVRAEYFAPDRHARPHDVEGDDAAAPRGHAAHLGEPALEVLQIAEAER